MAVTVGDIYTHFPSFRPEDMIKLMNGRVDFNGKDTVSLTNIAHYSGQFAQDLSIFTAKHEGKTYTKLLSDNERSQVTEAANLKDENSSNIKNNKEKNVHSIPMNTSIFNIPKREINAA